MCLQGQIPCNVVHVVYIYFRREIDTHDRKYIDNKEIVSIRIDHIVFIETYSRYHIFTFYLNYAFSFVTVTSRVTSLVYFHSSFW